MVKPEKNQEQKKENQGNPISDKDKEEGPQDWHDLFYLLSAPNWMAFTKERNVQLRYKIWTQSEWILFDDEYNEIGRHFHGLGQVPIVCISP